MLFRFLLRHMLFFCAALVFSSQLYSQGVTTASMSGIVMSEKGEALPGAIVVVVHEPTGTRYGASTRSTGQYNIPNMKIGGPYSVTASLVGYKGESQKEIYLSLGQEMRIDFWLVETTVEGQEVVIIAETDPVLNSGRTGAATYVDRNAVKELPSIKRSTRDLTRLDPRSDGNFSFGGRNWLFNNISLDGSYFNNPFGLDDPAPGGQTGAEPVPFDAVDQVQVSIAPFDVREGGFTGAGINTVTKSGTNMVKGSIYSFIRNESLLGNTVRGTDVIANPDLSFNQSGVSVGGPIIENELFFFINAELERRDDPGSNFVANRGQSGAGVSRVRASALDSIRNRMIQVYGYDPGAYEGYINETNNEKLLLKLDWNANENHNITFRYNMLNAKRDLGPHPFVLSANNTGRGPNSNSLPFQNSGYAINNKLNSFALEVNSRYDEFANRFFVSYNRFRDNRDPRSKPFPTIEIAEGGVTYTTLGHEPFSIHNILDQDVLQLTNNFSFYMDNHVFTVGATYEKFSFFNAFNIFRYGVFFLGPPSTAGGFGGTTFSSLQQFFKYTNPADTSFLNFNAMTAAADAGPFKGEDIDVGQLAFYAQDEFLVNEDLNLTYGVRVDIPMYTNPVANPFSTSLTALDENDKTEKVDQSKLPETALLLSPRVGFNWDVNGDRTMQLRGGTGIFTGRVPFVWIGNVISNPGQNPNLPAHLRSFDVNAAASDFKWPQVWTTNLALDHQLPWDVLGTLEVLYSKDINAVYIRNADLRTPIRTLPDGRPYFGGAAFPVNPFELNADGGAGIYVIDNTDEGYNYSIAAQLRKRFESGLSTSLGYAYLEAQNVMQSTEIASVLWSGNPVQGDPNKPELSYSQFGIRHRFTASATYKISWSDQWATSFGLFAEVSEGNRFAGSGGNRYSFTYAGDVNGDGQGGNDLIYIPKDQNDIIFVNYTDATGTVYTPAQQYAAFNTFIEQDDYLKNNRGKIAERFGAVNPWFANMDLKILQDFMIPMGGSNHTFQLTFDILNVLNLISSDWGVRSVASPLATSPLQFKGFDGSGNPTFNFDPSIKETYVDDPGLDSRWQIQIGLRYMFN
ncbi:MAG: TonB-dependent receptor [Ignavibacteriales bacterium]|nr:TonB-dependent receptor [Ignavibacteriales bacterium]